MTKHKNWTSNKLKNPNWYNTQKLNLWQNIETQIVTKLRNSNSDKSKLLVRTTWHLYNRWDVLWAAFCDVAIFLLQSIKYYNTEIFTYIYPNIFFLRTAHQRTRTLWGPTSWGGWGRYSVCRSCSWVWQQIQMIIAHGMKQDVAEMENHTSVRLLVLQKKNMKIIEVGLILL